MRRVTAAALAALLVLALTGCGEDRGEDSGGDVPWWVFWMAASNHSRTEVHYVPAPGNGYRAPAPRPAFKAPAYRAPARTK